jgi:tRNA(Ile)-lysidine synthase TilS/MesJ
MICKKCVLPQYEPDITLNEEGICNICVAFEQNKKFRETNYFLESDLIKILNKYCDRGKYDCLVMASGGKDSTISLYYMKKKYKMNPLVVTFDHGFECNEALDNVKKAVDILGVDWLYYKTGFMKDIFRKIVNFNSKAPICHVCAIWYIGVIHDLALRYGIPLIVAGWTKGQSTQNTEVGNEYRSMSLATEEFIKKYLHSYPEYKWFPINIKDVLRQAHRKFKTRIISPHWYLKWDSENMKNILQKELEWRMPALSYPANSTNCLMNFVNVYLSMRHYGYTHYHVEMSKLIRLGELSREEALKLLEINFGLPLVNSVLSRIGCSLE